VYAPSLPSSVSRAVTSPESRGVGPEGPLVWTESFTGSPIRTEVFSRNVAFASLKRSTNRSGTLALSST
jgi:hypothetical protein